MAKSTKNVAEDNGLIEFPIGIVDCSYATEHVNVQLGNEKRARALKMLTEQLMRKGERVRQRNAAEDGLIVNTSGRAVLWLLDRVADAAEESGICLTVSG